MKKFLSAIVRRPFVKYSAIALGVLPFAFGVQAAVQKLGPQKIEAGFVTPSNATEIPSQRVALVIGNANYPDANAPLTQTINDARALAAKLQGEGFDVHSEENLTKVAMERAIEKFKTKIRPGSTAVVSFGGFGIQVGRESYLLPVNAQIWKEADVARDGININALLADINSRGAGVKIVILDASRRNPFERRFRGYSAGLASIEAPQSTLILSSTTPGKVAYDVDGKHSLVMAELLDEISGKEANAETAFSRTRVRVSRASNGEQVPSVSSSLLEDFRF
jgi:uncharacterized caspase-like protein